MKLSDFDYSYPKHLVAQKPLDERDASKLMVVNKQTQKFEHKSFKQIKDYFKAGDVLVINDSKVFPCRLKIIRPSGGKGEIFLIRQLQEETWEAMVSPSKRIRKGTVFDLKNKLRIEILDEDNATGRRHVRLMYQGLLDDVLNEIGEVPLPPYITREAQDQNDKDRYQTVYASPVGSVAAPTAGFHFTQAILDQLAHEGVILCSVTLHVGLGTFLPIRTDNIKNHKMHGESYAISEETASIIRLAKREGRRVTVVGTTAVRALESAAVDAADVLKSGMGYTEIFISAPYSFRVVDRLITNFHQPKSTLLVLISAFAGYGLVRRAYQEAIENNYRLFSYGDSMLIDS